MDVGMFFCVNAVKIALVKSAKLRKRKVAKL